MKRFLLTLVLSIGTLVSSAMPYGEARQHALFLTDKMAYELNLNDRQYDDVYQINLDYFLGVSDSRDVYGPMWQFRNRDLRYILFDWQYTLYIAAEYFYRPLLWRANTWFLPIFRHYDRAHFYFHKPRVYVSYHGGGRFDYSGRRPERWHGGMIGREPHGGHAPAPRVGRPHHEAPRPGFAPRPNSNGGSHHPGYQPGNGGGAHHPGGNVTGGQPSQRPNPSMGGQRPTRTSGATRSTAGGRTSGGARNGGRGGR